MFDDILYRGYMSPEYVIYGFFSIKSDVYSFGVIVLEILSGIKIKDFCHPDYFHNLLGHVSTFSLIYYSSFQRSFYLTYAVKLILVLFRHGYYGKKEGL